MRRYTAAEFPYGLRCIRCDHEFIEGEPYFESPQGFTGVLLVTELICGACEFAEVGQ